MQANNNQNEDLLTGYGAIELGGTRTICAVGNESGQILNQTVIVTEEPEKTIQNVLDYFKDKNLKALGIISFGPVDVRKNSANYGDILNTPKIAWRNFPLLKTITEALNKDREEKLPVGFDTDANGSLLAEISWGAAQGLNDAVYVKIGKGIGLGAMVNGKLLHGMLHAEAGHIRMSRESGDNFEGDCPSHGTCFEGMASGSAIAKRWGKPARELSNNPEVWKLEAKYIAQGLTDIIFTLSPQKIIMGGGVLHQKDLLPLVRKNVVEYINNYIDTKELRNINNYIVPAALNGSQGIKGAVKLALLAEEAAMKN